MLRQASVASRALLNRGEVFCGSQLWTLEFFRRAQLWIGNFDDGDKPLASALLDGFLYFSDSHATQLMVSGFHALSAQISRLAATGREARGGWTAFFDSLLLTYVEGEQPNATDSGPESARKFRMAAAFPSGRALSPYSALGSLVRGPHKTVVFVDDFVGSGNQFISTWRRERDYGDALPKVSFAQLVRDNPDVLAFYCPSVCTAYGLRRLQAECPEVLVSPGAVLEDRHGVMHPHSLVWPDSIRADGQAFVRRVSQRLGLPESDGDEEDWRGFEALGLAVAIRDSIPDASLRLFHLQQDGWAPLVKRR